MSRTASKLKKAQGKLATLVNGHDVYFRYPAGGLDVEEIGQNLLKLKERGGLCELELLAAGSARR